MQRGSVLPFLLVVILVILLGVGILYYQSSSGKSRPFPLATNLPLVTNQPSPSPSIQGITDEVLGLSFELPQGIVLKKETEEEYFKRANGQIRKNFTSYIAYPPAEFVEAFYLMSETDTNLEKASLTTWVFKNPDNLDPRKFYDEYWYYPFVWGDFTQARNKIAPQDNELIGDKKASSGVVDYRPGKPRFIYLSLPEKNLMLQIQYQTEASQSANQILNSFKFE